MERRFILKVNAYEAGVLRGRLMNWEGRNKVHEVMKQLIAIEREIREEAGVKIEALPDGKVMLSDKYGNIVIREEYPGDFEVE